MNRSILAVFALIALGACARPEVARTVPVDDDFKVVGGRWNSGHLFVITTKARNLDGKVMVCGAVGVFGGIGPFKEMLVEKVLDGTSVSLDGKRVFQGLKTFVVVEGDEPVPLTRANCVKTDRVWSNDVAYDIRIRPPSYIQYGS